MKGERLRRWKCLLCQKITKAAEAPQRCPHCDQLAAFGDADVLDSLHRSSKVRRKP